MAHKYVVRQYGDVDFGRLYDFGYRIVSAKSGPEAYDKATDELCSLADKADKSVFTEGETVDGDYAPTQGNWATLGSKGGRTLMQPTVSDTGCTLIPVTLGEWKH